MNQNQDEEAKRCFFYQEFTGACGILDGTSCTGYNPKCSFCKTKKQYFSDRNDAILRCREIGICNDCKYSQKPCELFKI